MYSGKEYTLERVTHISSPLQNGEQIPRIAVSTRSTTSSSTVEEDYIRPFRADDMARVLDFANLPAPPPDETLLHCETVDADTGAIFFPTRFVCLRGGYVFYFDEEHVNRKNAASAVFTGTPRGVIPLDRVSIEFPPGGRRVFREHATTEARNGYEMAIRHVKKGGDDNNDQDDHHEEKEEKLRETAYLVADSLGGREIWAAALRVRADTYRKDTKLRPGTTGGAPVMTGIDDIDQVKENSSDAGKTATRDAGARGEKSGPGGELASAHLTRGKLTRTRGVVTNIRDHGDGLSTGGSANTSKAASLDTGVGQEEQADLDHALAQFGDARFEESDWVNGYFEHHDDVDTSTVCRTLEKWQASIKKGLRGAVLEQYEYFVEASREMTTMGREIAALRQLVEGQLECVQTMKHIDFAAAFADPVVDDEYGNKEEAAYSSDEEEDRILSGNGGSRRASGSETKEEDELSNKASSEASWSDDLTGRSKESRRSRTSLSASGSLSKPVTRQGSLQGRGSSHSERGGGGGNVDMNAGFDAEHLTLIEIPPWLSDATEEISAFVKECRYTDATELLLKAKSEVVDILNQHEKLTEKKLSMKQLAFMQRILHSIDGLTDRMANRLVEGLRRKNEALKHAAKRERADPLSVLAPLVSPICLNDDAIALHLLVKLGRSQEAATAYATRRSLLLMESLHERPISSASASSNNYDVVIYAAQLSQSFFSCLAMAIEGFLDLFLSAGQSAGKDDFEENSSIHSMMGKNVPAGAVSAIVLWCDLELSKFASAFGGTRVLGNLALAPPPKNVKLNSLTDTIDKFETIADAAYLRNQLRAAEEMGEYTLAGKLRKRIAQVEKNDKEGKTNDQASKKSFTDKDRMAAIEIAAKCIDQAFEFASENLDSIGLPLTPRLAEYIRSRLKGCDAEIADQLEKRWSHIASDWKTDAGEDHTGEQRRHNRIADMRANAQNQSTRDF